ncbi:MAG: DegT/DnrJ/EryC1/StrS family aminotransferase [bacterium]
MIAQGLRYIPFYLSDITDKDIDNLHGIVKDAENDTFNLINNYENTFAQLTKFPFTIAVNTAMYALLLSLKALGIGEGDEVISASYTSPDIGEAIEHVRASLVFSDIDPQSLILAPDFVRKLINNKTKAIIVFDTAGLNNDFTPIMQMATSNGISVIHYTYYNPFYPYNNSSHSLPHITIFANNDPFLKGAMIATHMEQTHKLIKALREHGFKNPKDTNNQSNWYYEVVNPGFDCMMTGIQCALSIAYLQHAKSHTEQRLRIAKTYNNLLKPLSDTFLLPASASQPEHSTWQMYIIRIIKGTITISRDELISELKKKGVETSVHFIPLHIHPYYAKKYKSLYNSFVNTYEVYTSAISLPIYPQLNDDDVNYIGQIIKDTVKRFSR